MKEKTPKTRIKISVKQEKLSELPEGAEFGGVFKGFVEGIPFTEIDKATGELKEKKLTSAIFADKTTGEKTAYLADTGFIQTVRESQVSEGDEIVVIKLKKRAIGKGRTMNQYDIYQEA